MSDELSERVAKLLPREERQWKPYLQYVCKKIRAANPMWIEPTEWPCTLVFQWLEDHLSQEVNMNAPEHARVLDVSLLREPVMAAFCSKLLAANTTVPYPATGTDAVYDYFSIRRTGSEALLADEYDAVIAVEWMQAANNVVQELRKLASMLKHHGVLHLSTPNSDGGYGRDFSFRSDWRVLVEPAPFTDAQLWIYSKDELQAAMQEAGFNIVKFGFSMGRCGSHFNVAATKQ